MTLKKKPARRKAKTKKTPVVPTIEILPENESQPRRKGVRKGQLIGKCRKAVELAANHGIDVKEAMLLAGYQQPLVDSRVSEMRKKIAKYTLTTPRMQKLARDAVQDCLRGKAIEYQVDKAIPGVGIETITEKIIPTYSNKLAAAAMVQDRIDPVKNVNLNANLNIDLHPIDLSKYGG